MRDEIDALTVREVFAAVVDGLLTVVDGLLTVDVDGRVVVVGFLTSATELMLVRVL